MLVEPISASEGAAKWREAEAAGPPLTPEELAKKADDEKKAAKLKAAAAKGSAPEAAAEEAPPAKGKGGGGGGGGGGAAQAKGATKSRFFVANSKMNVRLAPEGGADSADMEVLLSSFPSAFFCIIFFV